MPSCSITLSNEKKYVHFLKWVFCLLQSCAQRKHNECYWSVFDMLISLRLKIHIPIVVSIMIIVKKISLLVETIKVSHCLRKMIASFTLQHSLTNMLLSLQGKYKKEWVSSNTPSSNIAWKCCKCHD